MDVTFKEMEPGEAKEVKKIAKGAFGFVEQLAVMTPKSALLAVVDGRIVGGTFYRIFDAKPGKKVGYIETAFVAKDCAGQGIGNQLYARVTDGLRQQGCETVTALVMDDNVASWKTFENCGYNRITFTQMLQYYGVMSGLRLWLYSMLCFAVGHDLWATVPQKTSPPPGQVALYFWFSLVTLLPALRFGATWDGFAVPVLAILALQLVALLGGAAAAAATKNKWHFRVTRGGALISLGVAALGGVFPMIGRFYPDKYERTPAFTRQMGFEGLLEWLFVLALYLVPLALGWQGGFWGSVLSFAPHFLLYHALPVFPFGSFGGRRIWNMNRVLSLATLAASCAFLFMF